MQKKNKWISVKDRQPDKSGLYVVTKYDAFVGVYFTWIQYASVESGFGLFDDSVVAWRETEIELPEPYIPTTETCLVDKEKDTERKVQSK